MKTILLTIISFVLLSLILSQKPECDKDVAAKAFREKTIDNPFPFYDTDPYKNQTETEAARINEVITNKEIVCAIKYTNEEKKNYIIR